jgi:hypothetical protein
MKKSSLLLPLSAVALFGFGCNPFARVQEKVNERIAEGVVENVLERTTGGKVDVDLANGGIAVKDPKTGEAAAWGANVKIPDGFPTDIPRHEKAEPIIVTLSPDKKRALLSSLVRGIPVSDVAAWYDREITSQGYERTSTANVTESLFHTYEKGSVKMIMTVLGQKDGEDQAASVQISREEE